MFILHFTFFSIYPLRNVDILNYYSFFFHIELLASDIKHSEYDSLQQGWNEDSSIGNPSIDTAWHDADMGTWNEGPQENNSWSSAPGWKGKRNNFKVSNFK